MEKEREVKLRESVYNALVGQYEKARLAASDPGPQLQVVDHAVVPERKSGPPRTLIVVGGVFLGLIFGVAWLLFGSIVLRPATALQESQPAGKS